MQVILPSVFYITCSRNFADCQVIVLITKTIVCIHTNGCYHILPKEHIWYFPRIYTCSVIGHMNGTLPNSGLIPRSLIVSFWTIWPHSHIARSLIRTILASFPGHSLSPSRPFWHHSQPIKPSMVVPSLSVCYTLYARNFFSPSHSSEPGWPAHGGLHCGFLHSPPVGDPSQAQPGECHPLH